MNTIFIEAEKPETAEYYFLKALMEKYFPDIQYELIPMRGVANLFNETVMNLLRSKMAEGNACMAILDADTEAKGWGFQRRLEDVRAKQTGNGVAFPFFLYPDNGSDGDVETLMESIARKDLHPTFFDCFHKYEMCVGGEIDNNGEHRYNTPDLKGKLHTYMSAQKLSGTQRRRLGRGDWLFDNLNYWDLGRETLAPLIEFIKQNMSARR